MTGKPGENVQYFFVRTSSLFTSGSLPQRNIYTAKLVYSGFYGTVISVIRNRFIKMNEKIFSIKFVIEDFPSMNYKIRKNIVS